MMSSGCKKGILSFTGIGFGTTLIFTVAVLVLSGLTFRIKRERAVLSLSQFQTPVLINKEDNPVLRICIHHPGSENGITITEINLSLDGTTDPGDIEQVKIYDCGTDSLFCDARMFGRPEPPEKILHFAGRAALKKGDHYFWVSFKLKSHANLLHRIDAGCLSIHTAQGEVLTANESSPPVVQRIGLALRKHGEDGADTYRIPGLAVTPRGTLLAIYDVRRNSSRDLQGDIDIGLSRSIDGGQSWEPMRIVLDMDRWGGLPEKYNGVSDANILVDKNTGEIFVAGLWMYGVLDNNGRWVEGLNKESKAWNHQWRDKGSQPGFGVKQTAQFLIARSGDDGKSWSAPENLTQRLKDESWWLFAPAPGNGITMADGTLVMPAQGRDDKGIPFSNIIWSRNHGKSWTVSRPAGHNTTESAVVQLKDGRIMLNMRDNRNRKEKGAGNGRAIAVSDDLGKTWTEHPASHHALIEPVCMASLIRHEYHDRDGKLKSILLFSNPDNKYARKSISIKVSLDDGMTWPEKYWLLLDAGRGRGYSCLASIDEKYIGILYEGSQADMTFEKIGLEEILREK